MSTECTKRPFVTEVILLTVLIFDKFFILFIDRVISQMHILILLIDLTCVGLWGKSCQTLLEHIQAQWLIRSDHNINSQIEFMTIDQKRVRYIARYNWKLINVNIVDIVYQLNSSALCRICGLNNPNILFGVMLLQLLVVFVKLSEFVWQNVGVGYKIEVLLAITLLHTDDVEAKSIFPGDLVRLWEVINLLVLVQTFIQVTLAGTRRP